MNNEGLKEIYNDFHSKGPSSWHGQGEEERELILKMGDPWENKTGYEIGCGEGDLLNMTVERSKNEKPQGTSTYWVCGIDYSQEAITKAKEKYPQKTFHCMNYRDTLKPNLLDGQRDFGRRDRIVMQGVLEHLDSPFTELKWMMDNLLTEKGDVITSSPCFLNPRGIVWMTLDMVGAVMSKTDLHFLSPSDFQAFCDGNGYQLTWDTCDLNWAAGNEMIIDLAKRIPLALKDGAIPYSAKKFLKFIDWLNLREIPTNHGATAVYRIRK